MKIGNQHVSASITVLEDNSMPFLFGLDMLRRYQCSIDLHKNVLRFGSINNAELPFLAEHELPQRLRFESSDEPAGGVGQGSAPGPATLPNSAPGGSNAALSCGGVHHHARTIMTCVLSDQMHLSWNASALWISYQLGCKGCFAASYKGCLHDGIWKLCFSMLGCAFTAHVQVVEQNVSLCRLQSFTSAVNMPLDTAVLSMQQRNLSCVLQGVSPQS